VLCLYTVVSSFIQLSREMLPNFFIVVCGKGNFGDTRSVWGPWSVTVGIRGIGCRS
jgi:hypothetical protein